MKCKGKTKWYDMLDTLCLYCTELEREHEMMEQAAAVWQAHHEKLVQENSRIRSSYEEAVQQLTRDSQQRCAAIQVRLLHR
jgi:hypothetical protein